MTGSIDPANPQMASAVALTAEVVARAREVSAHTSCPMLVAVAELLGIPAEAATAVTATTFGIGHTPPGSWSGLRPDFDALSLAEARRRRCVYARSDEGSVHLVIDDPFSEQFHHWAALHHPRVPVLLRHPDAFAQWFDEIEHAMTAMSSVGVSSNEHAEHGAGAEELSLASIEQSDSPVVQLVNSTLYDALKAGASDVHLESDAQGLAIKFRLDGVLSIAGRAQGRALAEQVISRIKVMAELDIAERRVPQDGRLQVARAGRAIDVRVSVMPSIHGEDAVLRILDREHLARTLDGLTLEALGFDEEIAPAVRRLATRSHGMLLVTGPTGSGKTTTLYAALAQTHNARDKTITIEDPVEYQLPEVLQIPVNEKKGLTFARGLRSILRHDPDRILVGEIRDAETAEIAVQSALTGHLVFTTVHANNTLDVFGRFATFGVDPYSFVSALNGILAQRLVRRVCAHCATPWRPDAQTLDASDVPDTLRASGRWVQASGCDACRGTGYRGRFAIGELLRLSPTLRALIAARAPLTEVEAAAHGDGFVTLRQRVLRAAAAGNTTLEEADRVVAPL